MPFVEIDRLDYTSLVTNIDLERCENVGADDLTLGAGTFASPGATLVGAASAGADLTHALFLGGHSFRRHVQRGTVKTGEATTLAKWTVSVQARIKTANPLGNAQLSLTAKKSNGQGGTTGSELCTTGAQNLKAAGADTWATYTFEIDHDAGSTTRGSIILLYLQATNLDSGGGSGGQIEIGEIKITANER